MLYLWFSNFNANDIIATHMILKKKNMLTSVVMEELTFCKDEE
jgi:hypothetical protein